MLVNIIHFPPVKDRKDDEFREWFAWSNEQYEDHEGFISWRILKLREDANYVGIVKHESYETFMAMHESSTQTEARKRIDPLLEGDPEPQFYEVIVGQP
ncbi:hypothetical protein AKJ51_03820 [candidate division MSBL1 archaeon SCGC-AAA382A20]|uniref:ABM domain-containing protein n=1 Tax=candidate division MSBL1 archaeon SCGC-AAA382A20 TaxID=1698280 RepID=A0A133VIX6_9EURY|nr:hypothetical protein AKJ51_03820 [candidate division MSBL1 archaeon SCGC-AAA382A20]